MRSMVGMDALGAVASLAEQNLAQWKSLQERHFPGPESQRPGKAGPKD
jgi:hypothetical protein